MRRRLLQYLLVFSSTAVFGQTNILFVGNSLTYTNDLPLLVKKIAKADGVSINTQTIAFPNYALEDHWNEMRVRDALQTTRFDLAVFQQGPSALAASREDLIEYTLKFAELCKKQEVRMCLYMVWPASQRGFDFQNVIKSYSLAADTSGSILLPAGKAWNRVLQEKRDFPLYSEDGFHPTIHGSYLSALVIYATLLKRTDLDFLTIDDLPSKSITQADLDLMKQMAIESGND